MPSRTLCEDFGCDLLCYVQESKYEQHITILASIIGVKMWLPWVANLSWKHCTRVPHVTFAINVRRCKFSLYKNFCAFNFRGWLTPRKYFTNENFPIYCMYVCLSPSWPKDQRIFYMCILYTNRTEVTISFGDGLNRILHMRYSASRSGKPLVVITFLHRFYLQKFVYVVCTYFNAHKHNKAQPKSTHKALDGTFPIP